MPYAPGREISDIERLAFVDAVLSGKLLPGSAEIIYHFAGKVERDVMDMVLESSPTSSEAVSALASMSAAPILDPAAPASTTSLRSSAAPSDDDGGKAGMGMNRSGMSARQAMTLEAIHAHKASVLQPADTQKDKGDESADNAELEKVAAFICSYAGEQEAAANASGVAPEPPVSPFVVPRGTLVPSSKRLMMVIVATAEKTVRLPGFEAFLKVQHGKDSLFRFLASDHDLHSYYLLAKNHFQRAILTGGASGVETTTRGGGSAARSIPKPPASSPQPVDPEVQEIMNLLGGLGS